ncbi:kelch-like protein 13 [Pomacea canaliculata]|nr:kelch-like protein 13 [Pomacea canaliculata]
MAVKPSGIKTSKHDDASYLCLCSDGKNISVNPSQLSRFSGYFSSLLHSEMKETKTKTVRLKLISSDILQLIINQLARCQKRREEGIEFLEKNQPSMRTLTEILDAADYLDIPILREVCDEFICRTTPVSKLTFEDLLVLNHKYSLTRLGQALVNYMSSHVREICSMEGWLAQLPSALLEDLLASNDTKVMSEWELVVLVEQWLRCGTAARSSDRDKHLEPILRHIRVPEIVRDHEESTVPEGLRPGILTYIMNEIKVYKADPKSYRALHPEQSNIRRPLDVVVSLGTHDSIPSMFFCLPVSYASLTDKDSASVETFRHKLQFSELRHSSFQLPVLCLREFSACSLNNILYIAGGQNSFSDSGQDALTYVFELDLADLRWTEVCQMKDPRCLFYLGALNGHLYAVGGINSTGELSTVERYEPFQDEWVYQAPLPYHIHEHAGCVREGCLYISGGHTGMGHTNAVSCLNPTLGEWVECAPLQCARSYHTMTAFKDQLFVIGGCSISSGEIINVQTCESYSITQNQWTTLETKFPSIYSAALTSFSSDDETVLCFGGYSFLKRHFDTFACIFYVEKGEWQVVPIRFADARMKEVVMTQVKIREKTCMQYFMSTATV